MKSSKRRIVLILTLYLTAFLPPATLAQQCSSGPPIDNPGFCRGFEASAYCECEKRAKIKYFCQSLDQIYRGMLLTYGSLENACRAQSHTSTQKCIDGWRCYRNGGKDSNGHLCSGTGKPC